jgi:hypothetical protein
METSRKFAEKKKERNQMGKGACCKVLFSLFGVVKNHVIYDDPAPLSSFQYPSLIKSLILALFDSVLGKKNPSNQSREPGLNPSCGRIFYFHIQMGIS